MSASDDPGRPRQAPRYGEYATPEEVAALTGAPIASPPSPVPSPVARAARPRPDAPTGARRFDRPVTIALLVFGLFTLIQFAPLFLDLEPALERATATGPMADADFGEGATIAGRVLFVILVVLLVAAAGLAVAALRAGRVACWIPLTGGLLGIVSVIVVFVVVLTQTPGAIPAGA